MTRLRIIFALVAVLLSLPARAGADAEEQRAFAAALKSFQGEFWARAEQEWRDYTIKFPLSPQLTEAVLYQARALIEQGNYPGAVQLLQENQGQAGDRLDEYLFWIAESQFRAERYTAAAQAFERVAKEFPESPRALESVLGQASSRGRQKQWSQVISILQDPDGVFQRVTPSPANQLLVARGQLLLVEGYLAVKDYAAAKLALQDTRLEQVDASLAWQREYMLARTRLALNQLPDALSSATNLVSLAIANNRPNLLAEARLFQGRVLENMDRVDQSVTVYRQNLSTNIPPAAQRQTLMRLSDLLISRNRLAEARLAIEQFVGLNPDPATADLARLALGELKLREYLQAGKGMVPATNAPSGATTNLIEQALNDFDVVIQSTLDRTLRGKAYLNRGWAEWTRGNYAESSGAFEQATYLLPRSESQVTARFKWADSRYLLGDYEGARTNYGVVVQSAPGIGGAALGLVEPALYQTLRAGLEQGRPDLATNALERLLKTYPNGFLASTAVLLTGQELNETGNPKAARQLFESFLQASPDSVQAPEIRLAVARTYEAEQDWARAVGYYDTLLSSTPDVLVRARADYYRALDIALSGDETNALSAFTNFVSVYPTNELAPRAQWWIGEYYWGIEDFNNAELNYQYVFRNWPQSKLAYEARMMAARTAMARLSLKDARNYVTNLTSDLNCPPELKSRAMFAYGDTLMRLKSADTNDALANYAEAIKVFGSIDRNYPSNELAARAQGMIGQCYLQFAVQDVNQYSNAWKAFQQVTDAAWADTASRSQAEVGLATVLEKLALTQTGGTRASSLQSALDHYLNVFYEKNLREGEVPDLFWVKKAGMEAGRLAESLQAWSQALKLYERLQTQIPSLKPMLENKILKAREQLARANT